MLLFCLTGFSLLLSGCQEEKPPGDQASADQTADGGEEGAEGGEEGEEGEGAGHGHKKPHVKQTPDMIEMSHLPYRDVDFRMKDGLSLHGRLYDPILREPPKVEEGEEGEEAEEPDPEAAPPPPKAIKKYPTILLLHSLNGNFADWGNLPSQLVKKGYAVLSIDLRGHGKSTKLPKNKLLSWRTMDEADWMKIPSDLEKLMSYFQENKQYPEVDNSRVALMGGGLGANIALYTAAKTKLPTQALILLSPSMNYKGFQANQAVLYYTNPVFIAAGQEDPTLQKAAEQIYKWSQGPKSLRVYKDIGQGPDMVRQDPALKQEVMAWLIKKMPPTVRIVTPPAPPPAPPEEE
jgi:pimeloyl-ACP methyl ester carboxylesterase